MSLKTEVNRAKALIEVYKFFGRNIRKLPRWSRAGGATPVEIEEWNRLQRTLREKYGYSAKEIYKEARKARSKIR